MGGRCPSAQPAGSGARFQSLRVGPRSEPQALASGSSPGSDHSGLPGLSCCTQGFDPPRWLVWKELHFLQPELLCHFAFPLGGDFCPVKKNSSAFPLVDVLIIFQGQIKHSLFHENALLLAPRGGDVSLLHGSVVFLWHKHIVLGVCACMCVHTSACAQVCTWVRVSVHTRAWVRVWACTWVHVSVFECAHVGMGACP